jgi:3-hydroxy acid dehydrogenase / malonic semialdehyde reductase
MKTVLITGATSGIGQALAELLCEKGDYRLILCGRRQERLKTLEEQLGKTTELCSLCFDVRDFKSTERLIAALKAPFNEVDVLSNNAGNAHGLDPIQDGDINDWEQMLDINVKGLLYVTKTISKGMIARKRGQIINIGSIAAKESYPGGNVYCASKAAVDSVTQGMRMDLHMHNIRVAAVHPGLVETEFSMVRFKGDQHKAAQVYAGMKPLTGRDVASFILFMIEQPEHVNVADVLLLPTAQASATRVHRHTD